MIELKFKAWDGRYMRHDVTGFEHGLKNEMAGIFLDGEYFAIKDTPVLQFTGLKDKNGVDIYEGDILQYKEYYAHIRWWSSATDIPEIAAETQRKRDDFHIETDLVRFNDGAFSLGYTPLSKYTRSGVVTEYIETGQTNYGDFEARKWDFEMIGNVYENPNLLP